MGVSARRLVEVLFRTFNAHEWKSLDNIFIDARNFEDTLSELWTETFFTTDKAKWICYGVRGIYWSYSTSGATYVQSFPEPGYYRISFRDKTTIMIEYVGDYNDHSSQL